MVIAVKTDDFALAETDVSSLAVGEAQTIETDSGKVIDILRTTDGVELYVDGELLEMDYDNEGLHGEHMVKKHVEIICDDDEACDENVFVFTGDDTDVSAWVTDQGEHVLIHKEVGLVCDSKDEASCSGEMVILSDGAELDLEELREMHANDSDHKVIVIKKEVIIED